MLIILWMYNLKTGEEDPEEEHAETPEEEDEGVIFIQQFLHKDGNMPSSLLMSQGLVESHEEKNPNLLCVELGAQLLGAGTSKCNSLHHLRLIEVKGHG